MPSAASLTPPTLVLPDSPAPKKTHRLTDVQHEQSFYPHKSFRHELDLLFLRPAPPSIRLQPQSTTDSDHNTNSTVPQSGEAEDEYTLSAYGDISLGEVIVPPLLAPTRPNSHVLQSTNPQPRLRLKVQRPPMPKRRQSYNYIADPLPHSGGIELDERWPGSPRPIKNNTSWHQHQPLLSPFPIDSPNPQTQGNKLTKNGGASLERLVDELLPSSPSIRLSPPGSPASQAISLPQGGQKSGVKREANDAPAKRPQSKPAPTPLPAPPKEKPWRTRLPPRAPIPKWDI